MSQRSLESVCPKQSLFSFLCLSRPLCTTAIHLASHKLCTHLKLPLYHLPQLTQPVSAGTNWVAWVEGGCQGQFYSCFLLCLQGTWFHKPA